MQNTKATKLRIAVAVIATVALLSAGLALLLPLAGAAAGRRPCQRRGAAMDIRLGRGRVPFGHGHAVWHVQQSYRADKPSGRFCRAIPS